MQKEAEKFAQSSLMEGMVSIRAVLRACEDGISDRKIEKILFDKQNLKKIAAIEKHGKYHRIKLLFSVHSQKVSKFDSRKSGDRLPQFHAPLCF